MAELKKDWTLNQEAFGRLLHWLDDGCESDGERYLAMRRRLTAYFDRKNCLPSDELADETLNRVARKLEEKGEIVGVSPAHYCYIVAKFVFLEFGRRKERNSASLNEARGVDSVMTSLTEPSKSGMDPAIKEKLFACLERCLGELRMQDRELILDYYWGEQRAKIEHRSQMATHLGLTPNALGIRACRIRTKLEACVKACSEEN